MDTTFQTSFIPKTPVTDKIAPKKGGTSLFIFLATIIFFAALAAAIGVYFYKSILINEVASAQEQLARAEAAFEPTFISTIQDLDRRIESANVIIDNHITVSPIFDALQDLTLKSIRYTKFGYEFSTDGQSSVVIRISGESDSYQSIALQSDLYQENKNIQDPVFSNLSLDDASGKINFDLAFTMDTSYLLYSEELARLEQIATLGTSPDPTFDALGNQIGGFTGTSTTPNPPTE